MHVLDLGGDNAAPDKVGADGRTCARARGTYPRAWAGEHGLGPGNTGGRGDAEKASG